MTNKNGKIKQIIGPVVDVEFPDDLPAIMNALHINNNNSRIVLEVAQHLGENTVRSVAMSATDGLKRGTEVEDTGQPIQVPVGPETLGRITNVVGEPIDELGPIKTKKTFPSPDSAGFLEFKPSIIGIFKEFKGKLWKSRKFKGAYFV